MTTTTKMRDERIKEELKRMDTRCNCGGPSMGTDHSPDCQYILAWYDAADQVDDEIYEEENKN